MSESELFELNESLREWRFKCDDLGYFPRYGQYSTAKMRHCLLVPELAGNLSEAWCYLDALAGEEVSP